jgi:carboxymethylenebutenolidase
MTQPTAPEPAYVALPPSGRGPGVLVLHAWWGLNPFMRAVCDRLAQAGFVAAAPDLYGGGQTAQTVAEAKHLVETYEGAQTETIALAAADFLRRHPAVTGPGLGAIGFSFGAAWALVLSQLRPEVMRAVVLFYGSYTVDFQQARAAYLGHFAPDDEWEPREGIEAMEQAMRAAGREVSMHFYPGAGHWFFETDRPEHYVPAAAELAWQRTLAFFADKLPEK